MTFFNARRAVLVFHCDSSDARQFNWYYRDARGTLTHGDGQTPLPSPLPRQRILLLPASQVIFHPGTSGSRHPAALSWQLEPLALAEPESLFAVALPGDEQCWLAAVDRDWLQQRVAAIRALGVELTRALPDVLALPEEAHIQLGERWLMRTGRWQGVSLSPQALAQLQAHSPLLQACNHAPPQSIETLIDGAAHSPVNFLQRELAPQLPQRPAGYFLLLCALCSGLLLLLPPLWLGWQANSSASKLHQQSLALYQRYFPGETPSDPAGRFQQQYQRLLRTTAATGPLSILAASASLLATLEDNALQTLRWDEKQHQLQLAFSTALPPALSAEGLRISVQGNQMTIGREP